jgi:hypothetical protein
MEKGQANLVKTLGTMSGGRRGLWLSLGDGPRKAPSSALVLHHTADSWRFCCNELTIASAARYESSLFEWAFAGK